MLAAMVPVQIAVRRQIAVFAALRSWCFVSTLALRYLLLDGNELLLQAPQLLQRENKSMRAGQ